MENILARLNWKILLAVAILIFVLIGILIFISSPKTTNPASASPLPSSGQAIPSVTPTTSWKIYKDTDYQISYPSNLSATVSPVSGGGKSFSLTSTTPNYNIELQIVSAKQTSVQTITKIFTIFKFQQSDVTVEGNLAKKFTGSLKLGSEILQETDVVLENQGQIYKWQLKYNSDSRNKEADDTFDQILASFHFPKTNSGQ